MKKSTWVYQFIPEDWSDADSYHLWECSNLLNRYEPITDEGSYTGVNALMLAKFLKKFTDARHHDELPKDFQNSAAIMVIERGEAVLQNEHGKGMVLRGSELYVFPYEYK